MAYQINGGVIINDSRDLIGVATAGINDALYVGDVKIENNQIEANGVGVVTFIGDGSNLTGVLLQDGSNAPADFSLQNLAASGWVSVGQTLTVAQAASFDTSITIGVAPQTPITGISSDGVNMGGGGASDALIPTEKAVKDYVEGFVSGGGVSLGVQGDTGSTSLNLANQDLEIVGTLGEIETEMVSGISTQLVIGLPDNVSISTDLSVGRDFTVSGESNLTNTTVAAASTLTVSNFELGGTTVTSVGVATNLGGAGADDVTLPSQKAVKDYVDAQVGGNADLRVGDGVGGITTVNLASESLNFLEVANQTTIAIGNESVTVGVADTLAVPLKLTVNTSALTVDNTLVSSDQPVYFSGSSASGIGLTVLNGIQAGLATITNDLRAGSLSIGSSTVNQFSSDATLGGGGASNTALPTQKAVYDFVTAQTGTVGVLSFTASANGDIGEVLLSTENFNIAGTANEIITIVDAAGDPGLRVGFASIVTLPETTVSGVLTVTSNAQFDSGVNIDNGALSITGAGIALSVTNNAEIGGILSIDEIQALGDEANFKIDGGGNAISLENGTVVADSGLTANAQIAAEGAGIGLTVANNAYITGDLTVDGTLLAAGGVDFDDIIVQSIQAEGPGPLVLNGTTPGATEVGIAFTNGAVSVEDALTLRDNLTMEGTGDLLLQAGSATIGGQLVADGAGIGLTVKNDAYISGTLQVDGQATFDTTNGLAFGAGQVVNEIVTSVTGSSTNDQLPTALAVANYIGGVTSGIALTFTDGTTDGEILTATETLGLLGKTNEIVATIAAAGDNDITFSLPTTLIAPGSVEVTNTLEANDTIIASAAGIGLSVVNTATFAGSAVFGVASAPDFQNGLSVTAGIATIGELKLGNTPQSVTGVTTDGTFTAVTDSDLASAAAIKTYVDNAAGSVTNVTLADAGNANDTYYVSFAGTSFGSTQLNTDADQLTYNPSTGILQAQEFNALSDSRYKENIEVIADPLEKLEGLRGVTFEWKDAPGRSAGLIAQELQQVMPDLVTESPDKLTVNYNGVIGLLVEAVKELQARVEELEAGN